MSDEDSPEDEKNGALQGSGDSSSSGAGGGVPESDAPAAQPAEFMDLPEPHISGSQQENLSLILEIPVTCSVELGRSSMQIGELLKLARGSVVDLERPAGTPLDILVNGCLIAHGEVVVVNNKFAVRLVDIVDRRDRLKSVS